MTKEFSRQAAESLHRGQSEQRHQQFRPGDSGQAEERAHTPPYAPTPHQDQPVAAIRELIGELCRNASTNGMAHNRHSVNLEDAEEITHAVGVCGHRVVRSRLLRTTMPQEVGRNDRVGLRQLLEDRSPGVRAVTGAMNQ
jgi:hypothetical protein